MPRHGLRAAVKNGSTTSELAADAHACIMVRVTAIHRIQGCGTSPSCPDSELSPRMRHPDHNKRADVLGAVKARPGNDRAEVSAERRPALTAPARVDFQYVWVGAKKRDSKSNKETGMKKVKNAVK